MEFMLHRQLSSDDEKGMGEGLKDPEPCTLTLRLVPTTEPLATPPSLDPAGAPDPTAPFANKPVHLHKLSYQHRNPLHVAIGGAAPTTTRPSDFAAHFQAQVLRASTPSGHAPAPPLRLPLYLPDFVHVVTMHRYNPNSHGPVPPVGPRSYCVALTLQNLQSPGVLQDDQVTFTWQQVLPVAPATVREVTHSLLHDVGDATSEFYLPAKGIKTFILTFVQRGGIRQVRAPNTRR